MKARVINERSEYYGKIVNVKKIEDTRFFANRYEMVYGKGVFFGDELDFNIAPINKPVSFDWSSFRRETAKDILPAMINWRRINGAGANILISKEEAVKLAIEYADELIKQLKQE